MTLPVYTTKIGWETAVAGTVRCDVSRFDGSDVFANAFTNFFTGAFDDVTNDVDGAAGATITRGRSALLGPIQAGEFDFTIDCTEAPGKYDPNNASSPLAALTPGFVPMRPVTVTATVGGTTYPRFYGFIRTATYNPDTRRCVVHAEDLLLWLSRAFPAFSALTSTTTQAAIAAILDAAQWQDLAMRSLSPFGDAIAAYPAAGNADGTQDALSMIGDLITAARGLFFASAGGKAVFEDRNARSRRITSLASFASSEIAVQSTGMSAIDLDEVENQITITGADGLPATSTNNTSQRAFGVGQLSSVSSDLIPNQAAAFALGAYEVAFQSALRSPFVATIDPNALQRVFALDLQDRYTIADGTYAGDYHLEQSVERFGYKAGQFGVQLTGSKRGSVNGFVFDHSTLDGLDVLVA